MSGKERGFDNDQSGQGNHFEAHNVESYHALADNPTNTFCTINPVAAYQTNANLSEGNLSYNKTSSTGWRGAMSTFAVSSGKWYWEVTHTGLDQTATLCMGLLMLIVLIMPMLLARNIYGGTQALFRVLPQCNGQVYENASTLTI